MKLYAKVRSERAEKGQGGNKYLAVELYTGSGNEPEHFATVRLIYDKDDGVGAYTLELVNAAGNTIAELEREETKTKGNKQKGDIKASDICPKCGLLYGDCDD